MEKSTSNDFFKSNVLGHPAGLFVLFFTEMWERFSYYGMRALLVLFLISKLADGGWAWPEEHALALYGTYTSLVYLTTIMGGFLADKYLGYRWAVVIGALLMTLGHASMAVETPMSLYIGIGLLIFGNGFFKPNMTSIISYMYKDHPEKKDGAYTIFYMGVNAGAFLGIMLCGYIGENESWSLGFGLAGIFMFFGMLQFYFTQNIFGTIGTKPTAAEKLDKKTVTDGDKRVPFTSFDLFLIVTSLILGLVWIINDPYSKISGNNLLDFKVGNLDGSNFIILLGLGLFLILLVGRLTRYATVTRDRLIAVTIFAFFTIFFWASFEQAGGSMTIFAERYTQRALTGSTASMFKIINTLLTVVPLGIITYVLFKLFQQTFKKYPLGNIILGSSFVIIWGVVLWMLNREFSNDDTTVAASWFGILNSFFIIAFAPLVSKVWESKYNPPAAVKYGIGLSLLGLGFGSLAYGASEIVNGADIKVSMVWLIFAYLFHTLGELCLSPVGLSYVSKLVPARMIGMMFGIWYLAIAIGNKTAGSMGGMINEITEKYSLSTFFLIFTIVPIGLGILVVLLHPLLKKLMHGVH
ncbi:MFS transporter [Flavobacterium arcticum]|uniref:MFS transporter n=1 Tax=Flavobacterium arcticum TaxID=1784713 RepID=A0A345H9U4_9FLAO|nr:peptide MFS transporter [Flavobacterium arcticum]AXG73354.1 MFS transporter [Flavobacterium arcticum]KAF2513146.1 peptide MFS transporter [Flavobacterium arcticum]